MNKLFRAAPFLFLAALSSAAGYQSRNPVTTKTTFLKQVSITLPQVVNGTGTFVMFTSGTLVNDATAEPGINRMDGYYHGTGAGTLPATLWVNLYYDQSGPVTTAHGGAIFGRVIGGTNQQGFSFGVEGNAWGVSISSDASPVGVIGHSHWKGVNTSTPTAPMIGVNARVDITTSDGITPRSTGTAVAFRAETFGGYEKYSFLGPNIGDKLVNFGDVIKVAPAPYALLGGGTINTENYCGGALVVTSTGPITTGAQAFSAPSNVVGPGFNNNCRIIVVNGNLTAGHTITFQHSGTNLYTIPAANIVVGPFLGAFEMVSYPGANIWGQVTAVTK